MLETMDRVFHNELGVGSYVKHQYFQVLIHFDHHGFFLVNERDLSKVWK